MRKALDFVIDLDRRVAALGWLTFFGLLVGNRIRQPSVFLHDEAYQAFTAARYVHGDRGAFWAGETVGRGSPDCLLAQDVTGMHCTNEWVHPPIAKLVLAASIRLFGHNSSAWRLPCLFAGAALVVLTYLLGKRMLPTRGAAEIATLALALDGMVIVLSRTAMADIFAALTILIAYFAFYEWLSRRWPSAGDRAPALILRKRLYWLGLATGVALATKWFAILTWGGTALIVGIDAVHSLVRAEKGRRRAWTELLHVAAALVGVPVLVYVASYTLFFANGYDLGDLSELIRRQVVFNQTFREPHTSASPWWSWPLLLRPVWITTLFLKDGDVIKIFLVGNPALWWTSVPVVGLLVSRLRRWRVTPAAERNAQIVIGLGFFGQWLPWAIPDRPTFLYYILPGAPFAALGVGWMMAEAARHKYARILTIVFLAALVASAVYWWPIWTGGKLDEAAIDRRLWPSGWRR